MNDFDGNMLAELKYGQEQAKLDSSYRCFEKPAKEELTEEIMEGRHGGHLADAICFGFAISEMGEWLARFYLGNEDRNDLALDIDKKIRDAVPDYLVDEQRLLAERIYEMENPEE